MTRQLETLIDLAWEARANLDTVNSPELREAVEQVITDLNKGRVRVAGPQAPSLPVVIGSGSHPFPFRTRKLSLLPPMVLRA